MKVVCVYPGIILYVTPPFVTPKYFLTLVASPLRLMKNKCGRDRFTSGSFPASWTCGCCCCVYPHVKLVIIVRLKKDFRRRGSYDSTEMIDLYSFYLRTPKNINIFLLLDKQPQWLIVNQSSCWLIIGSSVLSWRDSAHSDDSHWHLLSIFSVNWLF